MQHQRIKYFCIYEHESLVVGQKYQGYEFTHYDCVQLLESSQGHYPPFLTAQYQGIKASHYVGQIATKDIILEILPKANVNSKSSSRQFLIQLLHYTQKTPPHALANIFQYDRGNIADYFYEVFITEVTKLLHKGLSPRYAVRASNNNRFTGKLSIKENIRYNYAHKEKVYTRKHILSNRHSIHMIISGALSIITKRGQSNTIVNQAQNLIGYFGRPDVREIPSTATRPLDKHEQHYSAAISWAKIILDNKAPNQHRNGIESVFYLFDMQLLFEKIISDSLKQAIEALGHEITIQPSKQFWKKRRIRPDLLLKLSNGKRLIVDTKWKTGSGALPTSTDLQQMYIYCNSFGAEKAILIYPKSESFHDDKAGFHNNDAISCETMFVELFKNNSTNLNLGSIILEKILNGITE